MLRLATRRVQAAAPSCGRQAQHALILGLIVMLTACSGDQPDPTEQASYALQPKEPWTSGRYASTRLILERTDSGFQVVSASPSFGGVTQLNVAESVPDLLEGRLRLFEYAARNAAGDVLSRGYFTVSLKARAAFTEADDPERVRHVEFDDPSRLVRVAIPFTPEIVTLELQTLVPDKDRRFEDWQRASAGSIRLEPAPTQPQQGREPS